MADTAPTRVVVRIYGDECALRGDGPPERLRALAAAVDARMQAIHARAPQLTPTRVAILAALQFAEEAQRALQAKEPEAVPAPPPRTSRRRR
jgi:cell division protein ZapA (FtsZ GTPase activity inhibitor)